jgi:hypothetical protein
MPTGAYQAEAKLLRQAASDQIFKYQGVTLKETTRVTTSKDEEGETYSVRAFFTVRGENVAIRCISTVRAAVAAFLKYINRLFGATSDHRVDMSLEMIVEQARKDIRDRQGLSSVEVTLTYIDQFDEAHIVRVQRNQLGLMLARR